MGSRAFDLLLVLLDKHDRVVTKDELLDLVWLGLVVEEANVQVQVSALRKLVGHATIATIPGRGYRFAALMHDDVAAPEPERDPEPVQVSALASLPELIGREPDRRALAAALACHRLVTIVGPGGIGKTRIAEVVAAQGCERYPDGVRWVDLAPLTSASQVAPAVARATGIDIGEGNDHSRLARGLAYRRMLLVLDNCEHLADEVARLASLVFENCAGIHLLATSQEPLRIEGEQIYRLDALGLAPAGTPLAQAREFGALQLLERRLRAADRSFQLDESKLGAAIELCRHLDGNALAIEMAAARVPVLGLDGLIAHLGERLRLLSTARRDVPARQQSLRAMLEWSHGLLAPGEQTVLRRLSVFAGSFRLEAAQCVAADAALDTWAVIEALASLADKSLVQVQAVEPPRYGLLESVGLFAADRLSAAGEAPRMQQRHGAACAALADEALGNFWTMADDDWLARYGPDQDDLEVGFQNACRRADADVGAAIIGLLNRLDGTRSVSANVRARKQAAWSLLPHADALAQARLWTSLTWHGAIAIAAAPRMAAALQAVAAWRRVDDRPALYLALWRLAVECSVANDAAAARQASHEAQALEDPAWPARLRWEGANAVNDVAVALGERDHYRERFEATLVLAEQAGALRCAARTRLNLADHALMAGDVDDAIAVGRVVIEELRRLDQPAALGWALSNLCAAYLTQGDDQAARGLAAQAMPLMWAHGWGVDLVNHIALIAARLGKHAAAAMLLGYADASYAAKRDTPLANEARLAEQAWRGVLDALGGTEAGRLRVRGAGLSSQQAELLARSLLSA